MTDYHESAKLNTNTDPKYGWYGYFYFYFAGHTAGLSMSAGGVNR